ncbi:MAG: type VI secretion system-associated FHA domain protein [Candidatus Zixiibacteriota bacterium]
MDEGPVDPTAELTRLREENAELRRQVEMNRTAHDYLVRLAHHWSNQDVEFEGPEQIRAFCERIKRSVGLLVREFKELLSGRKEFQREYALHSLGAGEGTQMIRLGDLHGDLGLYLFDWRVSAAADDDAGGLRTSIDELKHHQMALLTGYEHSVREGTLEVLRAIAPETIEQEVSGGVMGKLNPFGAGKLWEAYKKRYAELTAEDGGWFQSRFLPSFQRGYREYMWSRKAASSADNQS